MSARLPLHIAALLLGAICILPVRAEASAPVVWRTKIEIAHGRGERGPWRQNDSRYDYVDDPAVAIDSRGQIALAWVDQGKKMCSFSASTTAANSCCRNRSTYRAARRLFPGCRACRSHRTTRAAYS